MAGFSLAGISQLASLPAPEAMASSRESIDRLYWDTPYHLVPSGKTGIEAFADIREAMKKKGMVALGRLVMSIR